MSASSELQRGYSVLAFIGLYLLARYVRLHGGRWCELALRYDLLIFLGSTALSALLALVLFWGMGRPLVGDDPLVDRLVSYTSPLCIVASLSLLLFFRKMKLGHIRWGNWLAASSFSVYLLHEEYLTRNRYLALSLSQIVWDSTMRYSLVSSSWWLLFRGFISLRHLLIRCVSSFGRSSFLLGSIDWKALSSIG